MVDDGSDADGGWEAFPAPGPAGPFPEPPGALPASVPHPGALPFYPPDVPRALPPSPPEEPGAPFADEPLPDEPPARKVPATMLSSPARVWIELS